MNFDVDPGTRRMLVGFGVILNSFMTYTGYYNLWWNMSIAVISLITSSIVWIILGFLIIGEVVLYCESKKEKRIYEEKVKTKGSKSGYYEPKREKKEYRNIEYELAIMESQSGMKWVILESDFKFSHNLRFDLEEIFDFCADTFLHVSLVGKETIEEQWIKGEQVAKYQIDELYKFYEDREKHLKKKITDLKNIISNLEKFIENLENSGEKRDV